jgi:hypothetical protein
MVFPFPASLTPMLVPAFIPSLIPTFIPSLVPAQLPALLPVFDASVVEFPPVVVPVPVMASGHPDQDPGNVPTLDPAEAVPG